MRQEFPAKVKLQAYNRCLIDGRPHCEMCDLPILGVPEYDHVKASGLGGPATIENCAVVCRGCHSKKTHTQDRPIMQKADNQRKAQAGIKRVSRPIPGSKASGLRKKFNGTVEWR